MKTRLRLFIISISALLGTTGDFAHVSSGTLAYPPSDLMRVPGSPQPIWVPFLMGFAGFG